MYKLESSRSNKTQNKTFTSGDIVYMTNNCAQIFHGKYISFTEKLFFSKLVL